MSNKESKNNEHRPKRKLSKRDRRMRLFVFIMIFAMLLSTVTAGAAGLML
ncbi:MAG TPA: stressosome-associated protein Prli42 [Pseudogracilibacillus sp.]|nr:stressosome-associated protein Prli42 [Pseudogracilibacillus sp.]